MIIWQGRGFVAAVIPFGLLVALQLAADASGDPNLWRTYLHWFLAIASGASAFILYWLAARWKDPGRVMVDKETGREVVLRRDDTLFFIPLRHWATIYGIGAAVAIVYGILDLLTA